MPTDLQFLIESLRQEEKHLLQELQWCIDEWDFLGAESFKQAVMLVQGRLNVLRNLDNPHFDEIAELKKSIRRWKEMGERNSNLPRAMMYAEHHLSLDEEKLAELEGQPRRFRYDTDKLMACLEKMLIGTLNQFTLETERAKFKFRFTKEGVLTLSLQGMGAYALSSYQGRKGISELASMGFHIDEEQAIHSIPDFSQEKLPETITLLARVCFDVFHLYGDREGVIHLE